jgi:hypothetical protein
MSGVAPKAIRIAGGTYDQTTFAKRPRVEECREVLKRLHRVSTRYEKLMQSFAAFVHLAILVQHLRAQFQSAQFRRSSSILNPP